MSVVTINFLNAEATDTTCAIWVTNGEVVLNYEDFLSISSSVNYNYLQATSGAVCFDVAQGVAFTAGIQVPVTATQDPEITVTNFSGTVTVTWTTASGPETQTLMPGNPMTLSGFVS
ncbi:MAG: hypothetical protein ACAH11_05975 [Sphingomonas sp.]